jgi:serine/threonine protein kinase
MQLPSETLLQGGKYRIIEKIGQGGFGITYKAEDTLLERIVAIKEFFFASNCERQASTNQVTFSANNSDLVTKLKRKFLNEAKRLAKFTHNSIVSIHDVFEENGTAYFSMEYIKSGSLDDLVRKSGKLSELEAMVYIQQLAEVLHYLHSRKTCHLDIKPANVLLDENGRIKLIDFGLSKQYEINMAHTTTLLAVSKGYAPIEQYSQGGISNFSPSADIYSLGATLYFLLKGEAPPEAIHLAYNVLPKIKNVSDVTNAAILHAMKANSKERPQSVTEWLAGFDKPALKPTLSVQKKKTAPIPHTIIVQPTIETEVFYQKEEDAKNEPLIVQKREVEKVVLIEINKPEPNKPNKLGTSELRNPDPDNKILFGAIFLLISNIISFLSIYALLTIENKPPIWLNFGVLFSFYSFIKSIPMLDNISYKWTDILHINTSKSFQFFEKLNFSAFHLHFIGLIIYGNSWAFSINTDFGIFISILLIIPFLGLRYIWKRRQII